MIIDNIEGGIGDDVMEVFSPPRVVNIAKRSGLRAGHSIDKLVEKAPGVPWDLRKRSHQNEVIAIVERTKPGLLIGSPPCTWFSRMMQVSWSRISKDRRKKMLAEARGYLRFMCRLYKLQHKAGRMFLHEHPDGATSWAEEEVQEILKLSGVVRSTLDMCAYGLWTHGSSGCGLALKTTGIITNNAHFSRHLSRRCSGDHDHIALNGGTRTAQAAIYTESFCEATVEGYKKHGCLNPPKPHRNLSERDGWDSANLLEIGADDPEDLGGYHDGESAQIEDAMEYELFEASEEADNDIVA